MGFGDDFNEDDVLYIEIPEGKVPYLVKKGELTMEERETLEHILRIKRREKPTWGMG